MSSYLDIANACDRWLKKRFPEQAAYSFCLGKKRPMPIVVDEPVATKVPKKKRIADERISKMNAARAALGARPKMPPALKRKSKNKSNRKWYKKLDADKKAEMMAKRRATWAALPIEKRREIKAKKAEGQRRKRERESQNQKA